MITLREGAATWETPNPGELRVDTQNKEYPQLPEEGQPQVSRCQTKHSTVGVFGGSAPKNHDRTTRSALCADIRPQSPVGEEGVEPSRPFGHTDLNRARLPFRHSPSVTAEH